MSYIKFVEGDYDTYPEHSGNWDDTSKKVIVYYTSGPCKIHSYGMGYTDWDGDTHYWNIDGVKHPFEVVAWSYFKEYDR